jgi:Abnormal spindle-like microcephaly-assoc'd, ASPM-SPD-2-Hydin/IPT/TIG domain/Cep192 domain 4
VATPLLVLVALVCAPLLVSSAASFGFVQVNFATPQTPQTTVLLTYTKAQTAGNLNVVLVGWSDSTAKITSVTDSHGNPYVLAVGPTVESGKATQAIYYAKNIKAATANSNTVTVKFTTEAIFPDIRVAEYSGIDRSVPVDVAVAGQGSGTSSSSGSVTTRDANDLLVGASLVQGHTTAPGAGYTERVITSPDGDMLEDAIATKIGSYSATAVLTSSAWIMQMVAFRAAGPTIASLSRTSGSVGSSVTITGANFGATQGTSTVTFNGMAATPSWSAGTIAVTVPSRATTGNVVVTVAGVASNAVNFAVTSGAAAGIAAVQHASLDAGTTSATTLAFKANNARGNWIAVCVRAGAINEAITVTDSSKNTYKEALQSNQTSDGFTYAIFYAENILGGANTIRIGDSVSATLRVAILEYSGVATSKSLDAAATAQGSGASPGSGNAKTTANGDLLLGAIMTADQETFTAGAGYKIEESAPAEPGTKLVVEDQIQKAAGTATAGATLKGADFWAAGVTAFKAAGGSVGAQPVLSMVPASANFANVPVGETNTQTVKVSNTGSTTLSVAQTTGPGTGFHVSGLTLPLTLAPGASAPLTLSFTPTSSGSFTSSFALVSNASNSPSAIALSGTAVGATLQLSASATTLNFGIAALITSSIHSVTLTNTGNSNVSISQLRVTGKGFSLSGLGLPLTLSAKQTVSFNVVFAPTLAGATTGSVSVISTATNSPLSISLSGSGTKAAHSVTLNWAASASAVRGYYVYSKTQASGALAKLNSTPIAVTTYTDISVLAGQTYYYYVTAVDSGGVESAASNEVTAAIP